MTYSARQATWQEATATTIKRIQQIFATHPLDAKEAAKQFQLNSDKKQKLIVSGLTEHSKILLYQQAHAIVAAQGKIGSATEYWNTFVNTLRTLVVGMSSCNPDDAFDKPAA